MMTIVACSFCHRSCAECQAIYLINPPGGYGQPETWACKNCLLAAEPGSYLAGKLQRYRELYPEAFTPCTQP